MEKNAEQEQDWGKLYDEIREVLRAFGREDPFGDGDYLIVDDNFGWQQHQVEIHRLAMLHPEIVTALRRLLYDFPDWEIVVAVDVPGREEIWPPMGITIRCDGVIDDLQRQFLPKEIQNYRYEGSGPGTKDD